MDWKQLYALEKMAHAKTKLELEGLRTRFDKKMEYLGEIEEKLDGLPFDWRESFFVSDDEDSDDERPDISPTIPWVALGNDMYEVRFYDRSGAAACVARLMLGTGVKIEQARYFADPSGSDFVPVSRDSGGAVVGVMYGDFDAFMHALPQQFCL